jgi:DNA polymerase-4
MRKILHLDLDAFFCVVEELEQPDLIGKPFAVGGRPDERGVVASCSYAARRQGVRSAMPMSRALRLCPELIIVPPRHRRYAEVSRQVMALLHDLTPLVEQISIDEAFLDLSDLPEDEETLAQRLQQRLRAHLGLPCSLGVASNKLVAKIANDFGKGQAQTGAPPNAITIVPAGREAAFLAPLPAQALWGVGPKTAQRLAELGIHTIGDLAARTEAELTRLFGKNGADLARRARGIDERPIVTEHETKSISKEVTFARDIADAAELRRTVSNLAEDVGRELRREGLAGSTVKLKLRWPDFSTITRQTTLPRPTDLDVDIVTTATRLFEHAWDGRTPIRLLGVGISGLAAGYRQLGLWDAPHAEAQQLQQTLDELRHRFGNNAIHRARDLAKP